MGSAEPADLPIVVGSMADQVESVRTQILEADPGAYSGFVTDAACKKVAKTVGCTSMEALKAYRDMYPVRRNGLYGVRPDARQPKQAAVDAATVPHVKHHSDGTKMREVSEKLRALEGESINCACGAGCTDGVCTAQELGEI